MLKFDKETLLPLIGYLLSPIVRLCLKNSIRFQDFLTVARATFIKLGEEELLKDTAKVNASRLSLITGIYREDIRRTPKKYEPKETQSVDILVKLIGHWRQDKRFQDKRGKPAELSIIGENCAFHRLVAKVTKNIHPSTILFELKRIGVIREKNDRITLLTRGVSQIKDPEQAFRLLATDWESLLNTVLDNIQSKNSPPHLHIRTEYDNVFVNKLPEIQRWIVEEGRAFHKRVREFVAQHDRDLSPGGPDNLEAGARVTVQAFSFSTANSRQETQEAQ